ncbi:hypothetical protein SKAU_G00215200 [Synaphobranchus kaupii]|uniref:Secreted protein n=1 Tax=Synaphobranchus kaupii TaxID=118154 RepID=A0A9Q1FA42_SYNKA|nr:hypothetical protein SKAU_G00215200 [Synaphobranchus kaupii]
MWPALWIAWVCRMLISQTSQSGARLQTASQREHERRALTVRAGLPGRHSGALVRQPRGPAKDRLCIPSLHNGSVEEKEGVEVTSDHIKDTGNARSPDATFAWSAALKSLAGSASLRLKGRRSAPGFQGNLSTLP